MIGLLPVWTTVSMNFDTINIYSLTQPFLVSSHNAPPHGEGPPEGRGGGYSAYERGRDVSRLA